MATVGNLIAKANLVDKCGTNQEWTNPGESGTSYYFCFPRGNFQVVTGQASSIFVVHPRITFSIWYYTGDPGPNGDQNRVPVVTGSTINQNTTVTLFHNQDGSAGTTYHVDGKYHLFRLDAIRNRGEGDRCHVYYHPEPISGMSDSNYNSIFKGQLIYGIANTSAYLISGRGWNQNIISSHFSLSTRRGSPVYASSSQYITSGRWDNGV